MAKAILYVNTPTFTGGAEISLLTLIRHLDPARYAPVLIAGGEGQLTAAAHQSGVETMVRDFPAFRKRYPWRYPRSVVDILSVLRWRQIALVHTNCDLSLSAVRHACRVAQLPYVSHVRDFTRAWFTPASLRALNGARAVVANSQAVADALIQAGVAKRLVRVIYNPVQGPKAVTTGGEPQVALRAALNLPANAFLVALVGQIQPMKGHEDLVRAAPAVLAALPNAHFLVAGAGHGPDAQTFRHHLDTLIGQHALTDRFHFLGFRTDVMEILQALDVLVAPSWREPFGRVVVEGQAAACPVIGAASGGISEIITHGQDGLLIAPHAPAQLAAAIVQVATDETLRQRLQRQGPLSAHRFAPLLHAEQVQQLYDQVLAGQVLAGQVLAGQVATGPACAKEASRP
ncbi:MAG: glycosyltransferase family 4 protein [Caldilineaceae bacterium]|nr:glycosyltransferase family 4 protein [Caldilineaceae bacterium]